jgi:hypothetical protein
MPGRGCLGDHRPMTSNVPAAALYVVAPDVPAGLTLNDYRRRRPRRQRPALRRLAGLARRPPQRVEDDHRSGSGQERAGLLGVLARGQPVLERDHA